MIINTKKLLKLTLLSVLFVLGSLGIYKFVEEIPLYAQTSGTVIVAAGDIVPPNGGGAATLTSNLVLAINPPLVLALGDNQYPDGTLASFNQYYTPTWGRFKAKTRPIP